MSDQPIGSSASDVNWDGLGDDLAADEAFPAFDDGESAFAVFAVNQPVAWVDLLPEPDPTDDGIEYEMDATASSLFTDFDGT